MKSRDIVVVVLIRLSKNVSDFLSLRLWCDMDITLLLKKRRQDIECQMLSLGLPDLSINYETLFYKCFIGLITELTNAFC